jgi:hypothetical protein
MKNKTIKNSLKTDRSKLDYIDQEPAEREDLPTGPLRQGDEERQCSLLIFVPRNTVSALINDMTGGYGYSHLAVDCGEVDIPSGKRVMIESTFTLGVHNGFQDEYGERKFVRIPLKTMGVDEDEFYNCIHSKLGDKFDYEEALTIGLIHDPAKQICSDIATVCLPETIRADIARYHRAGFLHSRSALHLLNKESRLFVTPNGFAQYFGAPKGKELKSFDQISEPVMPAQKRSHWRFFMRQILMYIQHKGLLGTTNRKAKSY